MKHLFKVFIFLTISNIGFSQQKLTLSDAVSIALKNSLGIKIAKNNIQANTINNSYGFAGGLPLVGLSLSDNEQNLNLNQKASTGQTTEIAGVGSNTAALGVTASVPVYAGGKIVNEKKRLEVVQQLSEVQLTSRGLIVASNVMLKYYDIVRQQYYAKTLQHSIEVSQQKLDIVKTQREVGFANNADLFQSQLDLNGQLQSLESQKLVIDQAKTDLLTLLTLKTDSTITIEDTILVNRDLSLDSVLSSLYINPDVIAADKQIRINELAQSEIYSLRYPTINVSGQYNFNRTQNAGGLSLLVNQNYGPYLGVTLGLPIYNGSVYKKQYQIADINTNTSKLLRDTLVQNYTSLAVKTWQAYVSNLKQLETQQKNYDLSLQLLDLVMQRFQLRQATIVDVKNAQQTFEDAAYALTNIAYAAKISEIQLRKLENKLVF